MPINAIAKATLYSILTLLISLAVSAQNPSSKKPPEALAVEDLNSDDDLPDKTKKAVLSKEDQIREEMLVMTRQLGVTCNYCHTLDNFRSDKKMTYKIALEHKRITQLLNTQGFKGNPKVDCYLCHRGQAKPPFREPASSLIK